uniref:Uncharacterized protein n=1 Tax=Haptolina brevifila TaxID=156173 RepID=A0A7S2N1J8_9EUKA
MSSMALAQQAELVGIRRLAVCSSVLFPLGLFFIPSCALQHNSLIAFVGSYVCLGGFGFYCSYHQMPPFLAMRWFPDRKGLALSAFFISFGSGALVSHLVVTRTLPHIYLSSSSSHLFLSSASPLFLFSPISFAHAPRPLSRSRPLPSARFHPH